MNEFAVLTDTKDSENAQLAVGDLVTMTIVDVFETDNNGKLLSYCPTFDNRDIRKTTQTSESLRKGSSRVLTQLSAAAKSPAAQKVNQAAAQMTRMGISAAKSMADSVKGRIDEQMKTMGSPKREGVVDAKGFEQAMNAAEAATTNARPVLEVEEVDGEESLLGSVR